MSAAVVDFAAVFAAVFAAGFAVVFRAGAFRVAGFASASGLWSGSAAGFAAGAEALDAVELAGFFRAGDLVAGFAAGGSGALGAAAARLPEPSWSKVSGFRTGAFAC